MWKLSWASHRGDTNRDDADNRQRGLPAGHHRQRSRLRQQKVNRTTL
jgi:hypothetical protein